MLDYKELREIASKYFISWNQHNEEKLSLLMSDDIELIDWEINCIGKAQTLEANKTIFATNPDIKAKIVRLTAVDNTIFAELMITTNGTTLKVLDVLSIESSTKLIQKIEAYRQ